MTSNTCEGLRRKENAKPDVTVKQLGRACPLLHAYTMNGYVRFPICDSKAVRKGLPSFACIYYERVRWISDL